jgi:diguanylate cyclase (GGDEF)-like protein
VPDDWDEDTTATGMSPVESELARQPMRAACLTALTGNATGTVFKLPRGPAMVGRSQESEVRLLDDGVSRQHARVVQEGRDVWLEDLDSRNGTFLNSEKISKRVKLGDGDKVQVGRATVLRFAYHDALDDSFHESLLSSALRDPLTKLFNKRYLMDRLDSELKFARRHETALSLLMLDIDHFKVLNDTFGHMAGDAVLANLASVLAHAVRNEDVVARFGGEELAVILRAIPLDPAHQLGERLRRLIESCITHHQGKELRATTSVGVCGFPAMRVESVEGFVDAADKALYRAKHAGRNRVSR